MNYATALPAISSAASNASRATFSEDVNDAARVLSSPAGLFVAAAVVDLLVVWFWNSKK